MSINLPLCALCTRYRRGATCAAFPDGIPKAILTNEHDHRRPYGGDNGIQFKRAPSIPAAMLPVLPGGPLGNVAGDVEFGMEGLGDTPFPSRAAFEEAMGVVRSSAER